MKSRAIHALLACMGLAVLGASARASGPEYPGMGPDIYNVHADASVQVPEALARAAREHKRVLLVFGANWCIWCRRLHATFEGNASVAEALDRSFVVVMVDVNTRRGEKRNEAVVRRYGNPVKLGIPVLVVLESDGRQLTTQDSGELEEGDGHSPPRILAFLSKWAR